MHTACGHTYNQLAWDAFRCTRNKFLFFKLILGEFHTYIQSYFWSYFKKNHSPSNSFQILPCTISFPTMKSDKYFQFIEASDKNITAGSCGTTGLGLAINYHIVFQSDCIISILPLIGKIFLMSHISVCT